MKATWPTASGQQQHGIGADYEILERRALLDPADDLAVYHALDFNFQWTVTGASIFG
jgi:hypothetical protein